MSEALLKKLPFESRLVPQSRPVVDKRGKTGYEHNSWLEVGERVELALGGTEVVVAEGSHWNPITRDEFVKVLVTREGGTQECMTVPAHEVRRKVLASA
jgi:hypothetical protein